MKQRIKLIMLIILLIALSAPTFAKMTKDEIYLAFTQANQAFSQANNETDDSVAQELYNKAILSYEKIIEAGQIHNAKLYYNLANSYLLTDRLGKAILNYHRAERLDSSNPDIHKNLQYARSKCVDRFAVTTQKKILERLFFWHYDISTQTRFVIGGISLTFLCVWLICKMWIAKWPSVLAVPVIMLIVLVCMIVSVGVDFYAAANDRSGVIVADSVIARQGDGMNYSPSFTEPLHEGVEFDLMEDRPGWLHIKLSNGHDAWIPEQSAELI